MNGKEEWERDMCKQNDHIKNLDLCKRSTANVVQKSLSIGCFFLPVVLVELLFVLQIFSFSGKGVDGYYSPRHAQNAETQIKAQYC